MKKSSSVLYPFSFLILLRYASPTAHLGHAHECSALLQFWSSFTINPKIETVLYCNENCMNISSHPTTNSWKGGTECCAWDGITCDNVTGNVIELNLTCSHLQGTLHSITDLFSLSGLQSLQFGGNNLTGEIPSCLCRKKSLQDLDFSDNHLSGKIPTCLGNLSSLSALAFGYNGIGGPLPRSLVNCSRLGFLAITGNEINAAFPYWKTLPLYSLQIGENNFHGLIEPDPRTFPVPDLKYFIIGSNNLLGPLPPTYFLNSSLTFMDMSRVR